MSFPSRGDLSSKIPKPLLDPCPVLDEGDGGEDYGFGIRHRSTPLCLEGALDGLQYNPFRHQLGNHLRDPQGGIDFREVVNLWNWMDASAPIPSWTLPDTAWHPSTVPWIMAEWWNYEEVEEIFIYTDGSANKSESSAAAVIFLRAGIEWYLSTAPTTRSTLRTPCRIAWDSPWIPLVEPFIEGPCSPLWAGALCSFCL